VYFANMHEIVNNSRARCSRLNVDKRTNRGRIGLEDTDLKDKLSFNSLLIHHALPVLRLIENHFSALTDRVLVIADKEGYILHMEGNTSALTMADKIIFVPGAKWTEDMVGTNAIGTSLVENTLVQTNSDDHYCDFKLWSCTATTINDALNNIIGVIDVSIRGITAPTILKELMLKAKQLIEQNIGIQKDRELYLQILQYFISRDCNSGILLVDPEGYIRLANEKCREILKLSNDCIRNKLISSVLEEGNVLYACFKSQNFEKSLKLEINNNPVIANVIPVQPKMNNTFAIITLTENRPVVSHIPSPEKNDPFGALIGSSAEFLKSKDIARKVAQSQGDVLLLGETGTGKDLFAKAIHDSSERNTGPFIAFNCASVPKELMASELFGYEEGAFTGAKKEGKAGVFERAHRGTLLLDEIGEMPIDVQAMLLRVLEERQVTRLGGNKGKPVDLRVISATNADLDAHIENGRFRKDLYYRLSALKISLPPLRERRDDIMALAEHFIDLSLKGKKIGKPILSDEVKNSLRAYNWPGNIRELKNIITFILTLYEGISEIQFAHLPQEIGWKQQSTINSALKEAEREMIIKALLESRANVSQAAKRLRMPRRTLYRKIDKYDISIEAIKC